MIVKLLQSLFKLEALSEIKVQFLQNLCSIVLHLVSSICTLLVTRA